MATMGRGERAREVCATIAGQRVVGASVLTPPQVSNLFPSATEEEARRAVVVLVTMEDGSILFASADAAGDVPGTLNMIGRGES